MSRDKKTNNHADNSLVFKESWDKATNCIITLGLSLIFLVLPLWLHDGYFDILQAKYQCFYVIALAMFLIWLCASMIFCLIDWKEFKRSNTRQAMLQFKNRYKDRLLVISDIAVLMYWGGAVISTCRSKYVYESFWGNEGRYTGLFLISIYVLLFWIVSHHWIMKECVTDVFLGTGLIVCVLGILHYFKIDLLNLHDNVNPDQIPIFVSTLGNINTYTAYVGMIAGFSGLMFALSDEKPRTLWYLVCYLISLVALITGISDNAYLSVAALLGIGPLLLLKKKNTAIRYLFLVLCFFTVCLALIVVSNQAGDAVVGLESICGLLGRIRAFPYFVGALWIGFACVCLMLSKNMITYDNIADIIIKLWIAILLCVTIGTFGLLWYANKNADVSSHLGSLGNYLLIDDHWGTNRGYIWKFCVKVWRDFSLPRKIWGYGPETFGILSLNEVYDEMVAVTGQFFDNAHNEYMQLLVTNGIWGVVSYLIFLGASIIKSLKEYKGNPVIAACGMAALCYAVQAVVNLNLPIVTPFMWVLLSMGIAGCRSDKNGV